MHRSRLARRLVSIPAVLLGSAAAILALPLLLAAAALADAILGWRRKRMLRLLGIVLTYLGIELIAIVGATVLWLLTGFGLAMRSRWSQRLHHRLQMWIIGRLFDAIVVFGDARLTITGDEVIEPGPIIVLGRHASFPDAIVPVVLVGCGHDMPVRFVLKEELSVLPVFDLIGHRLPNHFVDRTPESGDRGDEDAIVALARGLQPDEAAIIFPEGTFFTEQRHQRAVARIAERSPEHADQARALRHVLPPRPAGTLALLEGAPHADVVTIAHVGFEPFGSLGQIFRNIPFRAPVEIAVRRIPRAEIPIDPEDQVDWLWDLWEHLDAWVSERSSVEQR